MDKYEYKIRAEEIRNLIAREEYLEAAKIADTIDWTCVKKVGTLCTISDLYKKVRRYEEAIELLKLADQRNPEGKDITYSLCELYIKTGDVVHAVESYKTFVRIAARDPRRYVLQYKLIVAQDVSLEERIEVLEELKKRDYREKWAYELAYLYHRIGLGTKCVEECDELILWFGEGRYVYKAMELKMLHQPLTPAQQQKYDNRFRADADEVDEPEDAEELSPADAKEQLPEVTRADEEAAIALGATREFHAVTEEDLMNLQVHTNVGEYNTIDLQKAIAEGVQEVLESGDEAAKEAVTRSILAPMYDTRVMESAGEEADSVQKGDSPEDPKVEVFFGETGELPAEEETKAEDKESREAEEAGKTEDRESEAAEEKKDEPSEEAEEASREALQNTQKVGDVKEITGRIIYPADMWVDPVPAPDKGMTTVFPSKLQEEALTAKPPEEIADSLTQEADGQISLVMPEDQKITKQITGQLSIADVMLEWERMKKENEERNREQRYQEVKAQTGKMFNEFEAAVMDSVLEKLEREADAEQLARQADGISPEDEVEEIEEILETGEETAEDAPEETFEVEAEEETAEESFEADAGEEIPEEAGAVATAAAMTEGAVLEEALEKELEEALNETEEESLPVEPAEDVAEEEAEAESTEVSSVETEVAEEAAEEVVSEGEISEEEVIEEELSEEEVAEEEISEEEISEEEISETEVDREVVSEEEAAGKEAPEKDSPEEPAGEAAEAEEERISAAAGIRPLTKEEKELFGPYIQSKAAREELAKLLDTISMASYTGNVILSGDDGTDLVGLATQIMKEVKQTDSNFSGKVAKITGKGLNEKKVDEILGQLLSGGLIIESAAEMTKETVKSMVNYLEAENRGIVVVMADVRRNMDRFCRQYPELADMFNARMHVKALSNEKLVAFAKQYALEMEYAIDELGILALHTRIEERQTNGHAVTVVEAKEIVDRAIRHSRRKTPAHFFDVLTGKRYDGEDRIILEEKDFQ